jgi:hypothetical protein
MPPKALKVGSRVRIGGVRTTLLVSFLLAGCGEDAPIDDQGVENFSMNLRSGTGGSGEDPTVPVPGPLQAGTYEPEVYPELLRFEVGEAWSMLYESPVALGLAIGDAAAPTSIDVVVPMAVLDDPISDDLPVATTSPFPADYETWLRGVPYIRVGPSRSAVLGEAEGVAFDVDLGGLPPGECIRPYTCFMPVQGFGFAPDAAGQTLTLYLMNVGSGRVLVIVKGAAQFPLEVAQVLESIRWTAAS